MASMKITVKILKPDSGGNMQRCWNAYSTVVRSSSGVDAETYRVMGYKECYRLLSDMVGSSAASNVDLAPVFEQYAKVESSLQADYESKAAATYQESCIGFRVFPSLLADVAGRLYPASDASEARQKFMKSNVLPLSNAIASGAVGSVKVSPADHTFQRADSVDAQPESGVHGDGSQTAPPTPPKKDKFEHVTPRYMLPVKPSSAKESAASTEADGSRPHATLSAAQLDAFLTRQAKADDVRRARMDAIQEKAREEEQIAWREVRQGPQLSTGTKKILKKLEEEMKEGVSMEDPDHLASHINLPDAPSRVAGHALYANAMKRLERQEKARTDVAEEQDRLRNAKRASVRSEAFVRRKLCREMAAACVYVAAQRANIATAAAMGATADGSAAEPGMDGKIHPAYAASTETGTQSGKAELIPWWLLCLTPGEVATVLHHTGFMTGSILEPIKAALILTHADAFVTFSKAVHDHAALTEGKGKQTGLGSSGYQPPVMTTTFFAQAVVKYLPEGVTVPEAEQARQLSMVWRAGAGAPSATAHMDHLPSTLPAVRVLALLQSLVTGAYDVRPDVLVAAAKDIGMARPFLLVMPLPCIKPAKKHGSSPKPPTSPKSVSNRSTSLSHVSGGGRTKSVMGLTAASGGVTGTASVAAMSFNGNSQGGGNTLMRAYSTAETHADSLMAATRLSHRDATHAALGFGLDLGIVRSPGKVGMGLVSSLHPDVPSIFHAALTEHLNRLRSLGQHDGHSGSAEVTAVQGDALPDPPVESFPVPPLAAEVLQARVTFAAAALLALKMLYSSRLAFLTTLTRTDGRRVVAAAASREVIEQEYKPRPPGVREELGDGFVRALHGNDPDAPDLNEDGMSIKRRKNAPAGKRRFTTAEEECTFAPALCKKSLDIADKQTAAMSGDTDEADEYGADSEGDGDSVEPAPGMSKPKPSAAQPGPHISREILMMRYKANVEARNAALRKAKDDAEVAGCTFKPDTSASASYRTAQALEQGSYPSKLYVPNYRSLVQVAVNSVPGAAEDANVRAQAEETPWVARAAPLDALAMTNGTASSRTEWLYHMAAIKKAAVEHASEVHKQALKAVELKDCTFKPVTNWGRTRALASSHSASYDAGAVVDPMNAEEYDDEEGEYEETDEELVQVQVPLALGTDAALVLAQPDGPAIQPHLTAMGIRSAQVDPAAGKAIVTVSRRLASAKGLDTHLARVLRGRAEKEEKKRLDAALSAGVLHKKAIVRDESGRTIVKPFAFVASFRKLAHEGYVADDAGEDGAPLARTSFRRPATVDVDTASATSYGNGESFIPINSLGAALPSPAFATPAVGSRASDASDANAAGMGDATAPLMFVDVTVAPGQVERLPVWRETDLSVLAAEFAAKHGLAKRTARRLEKMMTAQRDAVLHPAADDVPATPVA